MLLVYLWLQGLKVVSVGTADLLGSSIGSLEGISEVIQQMTKQLRLLGERLHFLHSLDAFLLLRHSISIPKVHYILRTAPCLLLLKLQDYDDLLRSILSDITNVSLEEDSVWAQASLPIEAGGLGIRREVQLALSAFLCCGLL